MNDPNKKANPEEPPRNEKIALTDDEAEKAAGGQKSTSLRPMEEVPRSDSNP